MAALNFSGTWKHEKNENFEEFLKEMKVGMLPRSMAMKQSPTITITHTAGPKGLGEDGDEFVIVTKGARTTESKFTVGEGFKESSPLEGKECKMKATWEGSKLVTKNETNGTVTIRELEGDKFVITQKKGDVTCRRIFGKK